MKFDSRVKFKVNTANSGSVYSTTGKYVVSYDL